MGMVMLKILVLLFIAAALWHAFRGGRSRHDYKAIEKRGWQDIERLREKKREEKRKAKLAKAKK